MTSALPAPSNSKAWLTALAVVSLGVFTFSLATACKTPIWLDEAHTYWVIRDGFLPIFGKLTHDVHPPLFFCLTAWATDLLGIEPWALRFVSSLAAAATIGIAFWTARGFTTPAWAFGVALLVGTHPLFTYYGFAARNYALFLLLLMASAGAVLRVCVCGGGGFRQRVGGIGFFWSCCSLCWSTRIT